VSREKRDQCISPHGPDTHGDSVSLLQEVISRKVLLDEGSRQIVEVEQAAIWKFLWWSGILSVHVFVDQNRKNHTVEPCTLHLLC
jgi:hypothetical protein